MVELRTTRVNGVGVAGWTGPDVFGMAITASEARRTVLKRINRLIADICRSAHEGIGKLEPLKYGLAGVWSRRVTEEFSYLAVSHRFYAMTLRSRPVALAV